MFLGLSVRVSVLHCNVLSKCYYKNFILQCSAQKQCALTFYKNIYFLETHGDVDSHDLCETCGSEMAEKRRKNRNYVWCPVLRYTKYRTLRSLKIGNRFFQYTDLNGRMNNNLILCQIMELVCLFIMDMPARLANNLTGRSTATVIDWYSMCREICSAHR